MNIELMELEDIHFIELNAEVSASFAGINAAEYGDTVPAKIELVVEGTGRKAVVDPDTITDAAIFFYSREGDLITYWSEIEGDAIRRTLNDSAVTIKI